MDDSEINYLEGVLSNEKYKSLHENTLSNIKNEKKTVIELLELTDTDKFDYLQKLDKYIFIHPESKNIDIGSYYRWINLDNFSLNRGGYLCDILSDQKQNTKLKFMSAQKNKYFNIDNSNILLFKKLTPQEEIILYALEYINN